ncbi:hypothetical protein [uncultured Agrobacterium sp.]|uniref:hypothetical protein n=1 Tax=uncultured Agrobacterium sp. TaxID=157277 RepID=UPI0025D2084C|nr:hypothetical protein [uncultured Agrobacterium sp.]
MPLTIVLPPRHCETKIVTSLENIRHRYVPRRWSGNVMSFPVPTYSLALASAAAGSYGDARQTGWRFPIEIDASLAYADISDNDYAFRGITSGGIGVGIPAAIAQAYAFADESKDMLKIRLLDIPSIYSLSVWLHYGKNDWFFEVNRNGDFPEPNPAVAFAAVIAEKAQSSPADLSFARDEDEGPAVPSP